MTTNPLPTLTFVHKFSNGLEVTLKVERAENTPPVIHSSHKDFHDGIEREYRAWVREMSDTMVREKLITEGEVLALALRNLGL